MSSKQRLSTIISLIVISSMILAACGGPEAAAPTATPGAGGQPTEAAATATQAPAGEATNTPASSTGGTGAPKIKNANTMVVGVAGDPESLDPACEYDTDSATV